MRLLPLLLAACTDPGKPGDDTGGPDPYDVPVGPYVADIRWTAYGVPHILAEDHGSLGYGMGYAYARDHACVLADQVVRVRSERSRWFGPGEDDVHLDEDFGWLGLGVYAQAEAGFLTLPAEIQAALVGYAAGYNRYVEVHADDLPEACRGGAWMQPITHVDLLAYYLALSLNASGAVFVDAVGTAAPPGRATRRPPPIERWTEARRPPIGSNGWALGRDRSASGNALVLSNTHFPAEGQLQWHEAHLTIPGELNVYGVSLQGVPVINVGFNESVAWTHTVSYTPRFNAVLLELDPDDPLRYRYDGGWADITGTDHAIGVLQDDGSVATVTRTLYRCAWGPVLNAPALGWSTVYAMALADVNANNLAVASTWLALDRADSLDAVEAALADEGGVPWVHIMAADRSGEVLYADPGRTPNWSEAAEARYPEWLEESSVAALFDGYGAVTIDGSDPTFEWVDDPEAAAPGVVPYRDAPQVRRTDFVLNANDNHWLPNPASPLEGYPYLYGADRTPRSARTRMNLRLAGEQGAGTAAGEDGRFTLAELEAAALGGRGLLAEALRDEVVARCSAVSEPVTVAGGPWAGTVVDLAPTCAALAAWGGTVRLDDPGAALWREFVGSGLYAWEDTEDAGALFAEPFDPADPVATPRGLAAGAATPDDRAVQALARATAMLQGAGVALDATLRELQFMYRGDAAYPVPGGMFMEGVIEIATWDDAANATLIDYPDRGEVLNATTGLTSEGYGMNDGNSWVMAVELGTDGPTARALMTYSQSEDPASLHFADQTALYGTESLRAVRFTEADIAADPELVTLRIELE